MPLKVPGSVPGRLKVTVPSGSDLVPRDSTSLTVTSQVVSSATTIVLGVHSTTVLVARVLTRWSSVSESPLKSSSPA